MLSLRFTGNLYENENGTFYAGEICVAEDKELFIASRDLLTPHQYERLWLDALTIFVNESQPVILVTSLGSRNAHEINFFEGWTLYPYAEGAHVRNSLFFLEGTEDVSSVQGINRLVQPFQLHSEDGMEISTWHVTLQDIALFREQLMVRFGYAP